MKHLKNLSPKKVQTTYLTTDAEGEIVLSLEVQCTTQIKNKNQRSDKKYFSPWVFSTFKHKDWVLVF